MVDEPPATAVYNPGVVWPRVSTVAIPVLLLLQVQEPVKSCRVPSLENARAYSWMLCPTTASKLEMGL